MNNAKDFRDILQMLWEDFNSRYKNRLFDVHTWNWYVKGYMDKYHYHKDIHWWIVRHKWSPRDRRVSIEFDLTFDKYFTKQAAGGISLYY